ncbi:ciliary microtubule inner protein 1-like [Heptranchias perlo]|uniref:ciliary microtubule inner protein 1-like n=1 Tax=Heptranchias perlo TaxID=212740 RepID=UPI0035598D59
MSGKGGSDPSNYNFVAADRQWTNLIVFEAEAAKKWANKWGFLVTQRDQIEAEQEKLRTKCRLLTPEHLKVRPASPISKYIKVEPSPAIPETTQGFIGWRSAIPGLELERYGGPKRGKWSFVRQMNWPEDSFD